MWPNETVNPDILVNKQNEQNLVLDFSLGAFYDVLAGTLLFMQPHHTDLYGYTNYNPYLLRVQTLESTIIQGILTSPHPPC